MQKCFLRPIDNNYKADLVLEDRNPITLGRGPVTGIKNTFCSRSQVMLVASFSEHRVKVKQLGHNPCTIDDKPLTEFENSEGYLYHNQKLSLLQGHYTYVLKFNPPPGKRVKTTNEVSDSEEEVVEPTTKEARIEKLLNDPTGSWGFFDSGLMIYRSHNLVCGPLIAAYDLDQTLIIPKWNRVFPQNLDDWKILYSEVIDTLKKQVEAGYRIVIFTNQAGLTNSKLTCDFQKKIENIAAKIAVPIEVFIAKGFDSSYRKPYCAMWEVMESRNNKIPVDRAKSFYCGDAAGRIEGEVKYRGVSTKMPADHSQCDYFFARNLGVPFFTPEEHFLMTKDNRIKKLTAFDPTKLSVDVPLCSETKEITSPQQELVLLVGAPATGKSRFAITHMLPAGYKRVNRDEIGTMDRCYKIAEQLLQAGHHVVVDNTNSTYDARSRFLAIAKKMRIPCRAFVMNISREHALHNNKFRMLMENGKPISEAIIKNFFKNLNPPQLTEGFTDIVQINFWPMFVDKRREKVYNMVLLEK